MRMLIASDIHGSAYWCRKLLEAWDREQPERVLLLGDLLYHGPRNDLPEEYNPKVVLAMLNARKDRILCVREDIGRHNALDKVIGWACIHEIDLGRCLLFTTGRMPADMVSKAIQCGVPVMASKTYPTDQGIGLARQANLTLVTVRPGGRIYVWNDGMKTAAEGTT